MTSGNGLREWPRGGNLRERNTVKESFRESTGEWIKKSLSTFYPVQMQFDKKNAFFPEVLREKRFPPLVQISLGNGLMCFFGSAHLTIPWANSYKGRESFFPHHLREKCILLICQTASAQGKSAKGFFYPLSSRFPEWFLNCISFPGVVREKRFPPLGHSLCELAQGMVRCADPFAIW